MHEWFYMETKEEHDEGLSEEEQNRRAAVSDSLRWEWGSRIGRYVAFCLDGEGTGGGGRGPLRLRKIVDAITDPKSPLGEQSKGVLRRVLELCLCWRQRDRPFRAGASPQHLNIGDDVTSSSKQALLSSNEGVMNETVLAKLLKLGYVRHVMAQRASLAHYALLLICLLRRQQQAPNLTLQIAREVMALSEARDSIRHLFDPVCLETLVRLLSRRHLDDEVVYCIGLTLQRLATASPGVRMQLSTTGLPRVAVPQLLTANLRVRAVLLRLLEQCFGSPHMG